MKVDNTIQDSLFIMAVSNSCMNPLVYGSYAMKCRCPCFGQNENKNKNNPAKLKLQRKSTGE
jgi:gonadotropin-releasing hormone receptor